MCFPLHGMRMQPADLFCNSLFCLKLDVFIDGHPDVIPLYRRNHILDFFGHILRINGDHLIAVFAAEFTLILQLQTVEADKLIILVGQSRVIIDIFHCILNVFVNIQTA
ncbi:hypothetical protein D3C75_736270 [compost metagenome]